ncbi:MAG TPA: M48 family metallopeptidase [Candidatus Didemnitutus sp.]|nr:M48 family metallopeptidase [Candidatus Didemnitutus sp.]
MDFFEAQDHAHRRTHRLVILFVFALLGTIAAGYLMAMVLVYQAQNSNSHRSRHGYVYDSGASGNFSWWDPRVFTGVAAGTLAIVGCASLFKWATMRQGGAAIAESVGGRRIDPNSQDLHERQLLNVVEEMAIASGVPVPVVYVLDDEPGINAFAAGLTTADAAVTVTRGTLEKLNRDELQGVIGHEFSHILNGDMRLNVRLTAIIFGILVIGLIGRGMMQMVGRTRSGRNSGNGVILVLAVGFGMFVLGYIGYFFGQLIQAAVSRQREFLADASSVQFTRNPGGIGGALKKIGGYALGSDISNHRATQLSHFFFAQGFRADFGGALATHPPIDRRIRAIEPAWDGKMFVPPTLVDVATASSATAGLGGNRRAAGQPPRSFVSSPFQAIQVIASLGALAEQHITRAQNLLTALPASLREAARTTASAQALVYALLLDSDATVRDKQIELIRGRDATGAQRVAALASEVSGIDREARLPLLQLSLPALRSLAGTELDRFAETLDDLVQADGRITPFEFALQKMLLSQLRLAQTPVRPMQFDSFDAVAGEIAIVLSALARVGSQDEGAIAAAFTSGAGQLPMISSRLALLPSADCGLDAVDTALDKIAVSSLPIKRRMLVAAGQVIAADGTITPEEAELFRALTAALDLPMPAVDRAA